MAKAISKQYTIKLSPVGERFKFSKNDEQEFDMREEEVAMLIQLFDIAASNQTSFKKSNECLDCIEQIENLEDTDTEIVIAKTDIDYLAEAWNKTSGKRPILWNRLRSLTKQFAEPMASGESAKKDIEELVSQD